MSFKWLVVVLVSAVLSDLVSAQTTSLSGTCASINYSNSCCPPRSNCQAADGNCHCGADCHATGNCCVDAHCPSQPRTCADVGITSCCSNPVIGHCDVYHRSLYNNRYRCSCNATCHDRNDCCSDATAIGCIPQTCTGAGKNTGNCQWSSTHSCFVPGGLCYCDPMCTVYDDCCNDVIASMLSYYGDQLSRNRANTIQRLRNLRIQQWKERNRALTQSHSQESNMRYVYNSMIPVAQTQKERQNSKKFRP